MTTQQMLSPFRRAITDFKLIEAGDRVAVGLSGGKDSLTLLYLLAAFRRFSPQPFELYAFTVDMGLGFLEEEVSALRAWCGELEVPLRIDRTDIGQILFEIRREKNPCSLCSKLRRGALNGLARSAGCNKLALGHHRDDFLETFFLSLIYEGRLSSFAPKSFMSRAGITLIRPMLYLEEKNIRAYAAEQRFPLLHNPCPANHFTRREFMKDLLADLQKEIPFAKERIFGALISPERDNLPGRPGRED